VLWLQIDAPGGAATTSETIKATVNLDHPLLSEPRGGDAFRSLIDPVAVGLAQDTLTFSMSGRTVPGAVPALDEPIRLIPFDGLLEEPSWESVYIPTVLIEMLAIGTLRQLVRALEGALYIGPLRQIPSRSELLESSDTNASWADGLGAWHALLRDGGPLLERTNAWLARMRAGCSIVVQRLEDPSATDDARAADYGAAVVRRLLLDVGGASTVLPREVGAGISQLVPVVVALTHPRKGRLVFVEQPELHIHPALQVEIGDLLIEAAADKQIIVETHSEHVILRLLRRIRETHEGTLAAGVPRFHPDNLSVLYIDRSGQGVMVRRLRVDASGEFVDRWPKGFFEERTEELF
jgi:hypothetical protein